MASGANPSANKCLFDDHLLQAIGIKKDTSAGRDDCSYIDMFAGKQGQATYIKMFVPEEGLFEPMEKPKSGDWLKEHTERGQTFKQFITGSYRSPDSVHKTVYLLPMVFKEDPVPPEVIAPLERFAAIFFGMPASVMAPESFLGRASDRVNAGVYQVHAGELLGAMGKNLKRDAFCCAGITMADLYPRESWNFVFGLASSAGNTGVYSLARYLSNFGDHQYTRIDLTSSSMQDNVPRDWSHVRHSPLRAFQVSNERQQPPG
ncbi:archaemetzincin-2-like isoform X2 [Dreissena polymorpha]|uniref:Archaemetzincin-2 n=1 Tax=Dreissena polymorpha TaxID=45954 RepID=A0A9D3YJC3_DREPO|nr:archaemetzincin-2-like isoform X2 [Dreissena polymorpha]KAH3699283.1 hypothetical protein DPMN_074238 [Dreissena polymorpha]